MFTEDETRKAHSLEKDFFGPLANSRNRVFSDVGHLAFDKDYSEMSFKRCMLRSSNNRAIRSPRFHNNTFNGSKFENLHFDHPQIDEVDFQFCEFYSFGIAFKENENDKGRIKDCAFDNSIFVGCKFSNFTFLNCNFVGTKFINCQFEKVSFSMCSLDSASFQSCSFTSGDWTKLNIEFSYFVSCVFSDIVFPVTQVPFIFGMADIVDEHSNQFSNDEKLISNEEYVGNLFSYAVLYYEMGDFFPAVNILSYLGRNTKARSILQKGIRFSASKGDFYNVSRLAALASFLRLFNREGMIELYSQVDVELKQSECFRNEQHTSLDNISYLVNNQAIQQCLLSGYGGNESEIRIILQSKVASDNTEAIRAEFDRVESVIEVNGHHFHATSVQHNSDLLIIISFLVSTTPVDVLFDQLRTGLEQIGYSLISDVLWDWIKTGTLPFAPSIVSGIARFLKKQENDQEE